MSLNLLIQEKNKYLLLIGEVSKRIKKELENEDIEDLLKLDEQRNAYFIEIRKIDRSISMLLDNDNKVPDLSSLSDSGIKEEIDSMRVILQDLIQQGDELTQNVKIKMDVISKKIREVSDTKKLISGYLSSDNSNERFINYNI